MSEAGKELLLEIGTEEIPAMFVVGAFDSLKELAGKHLKKERIDHGAITACGTPRRIALRVVGLVDRQQDQVLEKTGPSVNVAYDEDGNPTKAAVGFARGQGVDVEDLETLETEKGRYICVRITETGEDTRARLPEILSNILQEIPFRKSMRWGDNDVRFARPIHWIASLYGGETISFEFAGVTSGNRTRGHRFHAPGEVEVDGFEEYAAALRNASVVVDHEERKSQILDEADVLARDVSGRVRTDDELLTTVVFLVELPVVNRGAFDAEFLALPPQILVAAMREHQRYFCIEDEKGDLLPYFIAVSNTRAVDPAMVVRGNERVLRARLADAKFFYDLDMKKSLEERVQDLKGVVFQEKLGTSYDKVMRNMTVAQALADLVAPEAVDAIKRATLLSKADLVTEVVGEFPTLQGVMGGIYARESGESNEVAGAIREHYLPLGGGGELPESVTGAVVGIADRIETLAGYFAIGSVPTGTADPYGLRRRALGVIRVVLKFRFRISLRDIIGAALKGLGDILDTDQAVIGPQLRDFFILRFQNLLIAEGSPYDVVDAVLAVQGDDITDAVDRVEAIADVRGSENFEPLMIACKRIINIVGDAEDRDVKPGSFQTEEERGLFVAFEGVNAKVEAALSGYDYLAAMEALAELKVPVDAFFDHVMVMDKNPELKRNRLALLRTLADMFGKIADFSRISA